MPTGYIGRELFHKLLVAFPASSPASDDIGLSDALADEVMLRKRFVHRDRARYPEIRGMGP